MPSVTPGQTSAQDRRGSRAHPSGSGPTGSLAASRLPGGWDGVVAPASTGSLVCRAERWVSWEPPALPPTPKGVSAHDPVHGPSVSAWISHDSSDFWNILEGSLDPSFQRCRILRTVTTASTVLPGGGTPPATHRTPCSWAWPAPGSRDGLGGHSARGRPPAWREDIYTPASPVDVCFLHRSEQMQSRRSPASAGRAVPIWGLPRTLESRGGLL